MRITLRLLLILATFIMIAGCDRFEHTFAPTTYPLVEQFSAAFSDSLLLITDTDVNAISGFYADSYMNNGITKAQMEQYYRNLFINYPEGVIVPDSTYEFEPNTLNFQWRLKMTNLAGDTTFVDTLFTDKIAYQRGKYVFIGNQVDPGDPSPKQKVLAQMVTGTWCTNCTAIEAALHESELRFPGQFYYLEYHLNDILDLPVNNISEFLAYYGGIYSAPTTIFQGITRYTLANTGDLAQFTALIQNLLSQDAKFDLSDLNFTFTTDSLHASIAVTPKANVPQTNLVLNYAVVEAVSANNNAAGIPCRNVILRRGAKSLSSPAQLGLVTFSIALPANLPTDSKIVVWVQTMNAPWDQQSLIYNVLEKEIPPRK